MKSPQAQQEQGVMTPLQIELARHALGLRDDQKRSYRNRYITGTKGAHYTSWKRMERDGNAVCERFGAHANNRWLFSLTDNAARSVLKAGETLDPEDFPAPPSPSETK